MPNIVDVAVSNDNFTTLVAAVQQAELVDALKSPGPFTVFAPVNAAFERLPAGTVDTLIQNPPQLARILKYHVVSGEYTKSDLEQMAQVTSLEGTAIQLNAKADEVKNASIVSADIKTDNGIIHVIDKVLLMGP